MKAETLFNHIKSLIPKTEWIDEHKAYYRISCSGKSCIPITYEVEAEWPDATKEFPLLKDRRYALPKFLRKVGEVKVWARNKDSKKWCSAVLKSIDRNLDKPFITDNGNFEIVAQVILQPNKYIMHAVMQGIDLPNQVTKEDLETYDMEGSIK